MDLIQEVGSYAGFAAVVGLAVLSALYFSQARDVRRLREWAGRAPERALEQAAAQAAAPEQAAQAATRPAATGAVRPIPAAKPAAAAAAGAAGAKPGGPAPATAGAQLAAPGAPAAPGAKPATPGAQPVAPGAPGTPGAPATLGAPAAPGAPGTPGAPATPGAKPPVPGAAPPVPGAPGAKPATPGAAPPVPATAAATAAQATPGRPAVAAAGAGAGAKVEGKAGDGPQAGPAPTTPAAKPTDGPAKPGAVMDSAAHGGKIEHGGRGPSVATPPPPRGRVPAAAAATQSTAVLPASARLRDAGRDRPSGGGGLATRYIALIVAGVIVLGGAAAFGVSQLGDEEGETTANEQQRQDAARQAPINPSTVTVSVLNGTTVPGLAAQIGDEVEAQGFQRGNVANAIDQQRETSAVLYAEGADREARLVARKLGISEVEPVDPDSQALGGNASVVVIVGMDQTQ